MEKEREQKKWLILPCNGVERLTGQISGEVALKILEHKNQSNFIATPSILQIITEHEKHIPLLDQYQILAINGCGTQCVNKLLKKFDIIPNKSELIPELLRGKNFSPKNKLKISLEDLDLAGEIADEVIDHLNQQNTKIKFSIISQEKLGTEFTPVIPNYLKFAYSKYEFKVPNIPDEIVFNWNEIWAYKVEEKVVIGISDYMQQKLSDIIMVELPEVGTKLEQLDTVTTVESTKSVFEVLSPFSGEIVQVNSNLTENPELINEDPYKKGWICIINPSNMEEEILDCMNIQEYFEQMKEKVKHDSE